MLKAACEQDVNIQHRKSSTSPLHYPPPVAQLLLKQRRQVTLQTVLSSNVKVMSGM